MPALLTILNQNLTPAVVLALCCAGAALVIPHSVTAAGCDAVVGKWSWFVGGEVTINADGTFTQTSGNSGRWECVDSAKRAIALKWKQGGIPEPARPWRRRDETGQHGPLAVLR